MRIELRLERDEHETVVTVECDQGVDLDRAIGAAVTAMSELVDEPFKLPHSS